MRCVVSRPRRADGSWASINASSRVTSPRHARIVVGDEEIKREKTNANVTPERHTPSGRSELLVAARERSADGGGAAHDLCRADYRKGELAGISTRVVRRGGQGRGAGSSGRARAQRRAGHAHAARGVQSVAAMHMYWLPRLDDAAGDDDARAVRVLRLACVWLAPAGQLGTANRQASPAG